MDNILGQILEGIIQGITEFLPISSSGHIVFLKKISGLSSEDLALQQIALHLGTLISVFIYYYSDIKSLILKLNQKYTGYIFIATIPLVISALFLFDYFDKINNNINLAFPVANYCIIITGFILLSTRLLKTEDKCLNWHIALIVGCMQCFAVLPGISRSGMTISVALLLGLKSKEATKFSFFLSIPAILGSCIVKSRDLFIEQSLSSFPIIGFFTSLIVGYLAIRLLIFVTAEGRLWYFSIYCFAIGFLLLFLY
mgnify:FL=1|tara:strand:- start:494 stop:1258 length:765 start_codon:yes stop_codon:yes gene_type:complete